MRIAIVGLDSFYFTNALIRALHASSRFEIVACCILAVSAEEVSANTGRSLAELTQEIAAPVYRDLHDLFAEQDVEGVCIATRPTSIPEVLRRVPHGVHTYVIKPAVVTKDDWEQLVRTLTHKTGIFVSGLTGRLNPALKEVHRQVADGAIGQPVSVHVMHQHGRLSTWPSGCWYLEPDTAPPAITLGWYCMDLVSWFTNSHLQDLSARAGRLTDLTSPHPDYIKAVGRMESGTLVSLDILFGVSWPYPSFEVEIIGKTGALRVAQPTPEVWYYRGEGPLGFSVPATDELLMELEQWERACRGVEAPFITVGEICDNLRACLWLQQMVRSDCP